MRVIKTQKGFTIVETLIVLAVTSAMFIATTIMVSGQIQKYQFRESSINMEQRLTDVINDVRVGYFGIADYGTGNGAGSIVNPSQCSLPANPTTTKGTSDCLFVGKKVVIDASADKMITSSMLSAFNAGDLVGKTPSVAFAKKGASPAEISKTETDLPYGLDYSKGGTFYVLFDRFGTTADPLTNKGEGQSVSVYGLDGSGELAKLSSGISVCANNGSRYVSYRFGLNGSSTIETSYTKETTWGC